MQTIFVTGSAGFIGFHLSQKLLMLGYRVVGLDNLNDYYDVNLKYARLGLLKDQPSFVFHQVNLADRAGIEQIFETYSFDRVIHLGAQAGVRYSLVNPHAYVESNLVGFTHILEGCRHAKIKHLVYASSSSVYGTNPQLPFSVDQNVDQPISFYAATKKANELMAYSYSHLYQIPMTGLRFFTVYGPWGRPDMALFSFTRAILSDQPIDVYNYGQMKRDFTYIDDIVEGIIRVMDRIPQAHSVSDPNSLLAPAKLYNIGNHQPIELIEFIRILEQCLGKKAQMNLLPMQPGDLLATYADIEDLARDVDFRPATPIQVGIARFVDWYRSYYSVR